MGDGSSSLGFPVQILTANYDMVTCLFSGVKQREVFMNLSRPKKVCFNLRTLFLVR